MKPFVAVVYDADILYPESHRQAGASQVDGADS